MYTWVCLLENNRLSKDTCAAAQSKHYTSSNQPGSHAASGRLADRLQKAAGQVEASVIRNACLDWSAEFLRRCRTLKMKGSSAYFARPLE